MSPRAAWRLERLGFDSVFDYAAGKVDWMAAGLPTERADARDRRAVDAVDVDPPTCAPDAVVQEARRLVPEGRAVVVVNEERVVLGRLRPFVLRDADGSARAEDVMEPGPSAVRAHEPLLPLLDRMAARQIEEMVVTTPEGVLLGVIYAREVAARMP